MSAARSNLNARFPQTTAVVLAVGLAASCYAQSGPTVWTGLGDGVSFADPSNWSAGVPTATTNALVDSDPGLTSSVLLSSSGAVLELTIDAGDQLSIPEARTLTLFGGLVNNGLFNLSASSPGGTTDSNLTLSGSQSFTGTGEIAMSDDIDNSINTLGTTTVTNGVGHTIRGSGSINAFGFINNGLIQATGTAAALVLDPSTGGLENNGRIEALGQAGLDLNAGTFVNTNGTIFVADGSTALVSAGATVRGGLLESAGSGVFVTQSGSTLDAVTLASGSSLRLDEVNTVTITNGLVNNGTVRLNSVSPGGTTDAGLIFSGSQVLDGDGEIRLTDDIDNSINTLGATVVTNGSQHTIGGSGSINAFGFVNDGLLQATGATTALVLDPSTGGFENNARIEALGAAGLDLNAGAFDNTDGTIFVANGSRAVFSAGATVSGGTLQSAGTGLFVVESGSTLSASTLVAGSALRLAEANTLTLMNGLNNDGTISLDSTSPGGTTDANLTLSGSQTISGVGVIQMSDDIDNSINTLGTTTVTHGPDHTIQGSGSISTFGFVNEGLIQATGSNVALVLDPSTGGFENNGRIEAVGQAGIDFNAGVFDNTAGTISVADGSQAVISAGATISRGVLESAGTGVFIAQSGSVLDAATLSSGSMLRLDEANTLTLTNGLTNDGTVLLNANSPGGTTDANLTLSGSQRLDGNGEIRLTNDSDNSINTLGASVVTNGSEHTIRGSGLIATFGLVNEGTIFAEGSVGLNINPSTAGFSNSGLIGGDGVLIFTDNLTNDGMIAAGFGNDAAVLSIDGDVTQSSSATLAVEAGDGAADLLVVAGSFFADGDLELSIFADVSSVVGQEFTILTASDGVSGSFLNAIADGTGVAAGVTSRTLTFDVIYLDDSILIRNIVPTPGVFTVLGVFGITAVRQRRA